MNIQQKIKKADKLSLEMNFFDASTGAKLGMLERFEQINEHGFNIADDYVFYAKGELKQAAMFCLNPMVYRWPNGWDNHFKDKILLKSEIERTVIATAFLASETDRLLYAEKLK